MRIFRRPKGVFPSVDRKVLWKVMEEKGLSKVIICRVREIYKEMK